MGRVRAMGQWNSEELRKLLEVKGGGFWEFLVFGSRERSRSMRVLEKGLLGGGKPRRRKPEPCGGQKGLETWGGGLQQTDPKRRGLTTRERPQALSPGVSWKKDVGPSLVRRERPLKLGRGFPWEARPPWSGRGRPWGRRDGDLGIRGRGDVLGGRSWPRRGSRGQGLREGAC